jgi:hypothetical protein
MKWRNDSDTTCPPWGHFVYVPRYFDDDLDIVWSGLLHEDDEIGVPENSGFNSEQAVAPGEIGRFTVDLPTWCLIQFPSGYHPSGTGGNVYGLNDYVTYVPGGNGLSPNTRPWSLRDQLSTGPSSDADDPKWTGYTVLAIREIPEFNELWDVRHDFRIGFIGGMVFDYRGGEEDALPLL